MILALRPAVKIKLARDKAKPENKQKFVSVGQYFAAGSSMASTAATGHPVLTGTAMSVTSTSSGAVLTAATMQKMFKDLKASWSDY